MLLLNWQEYVELLYANDLDLMSVTIDGLKNMLKMDRSLSEQVF